jgi:hypothetical protein
MRILLSIFLFLSVSCSAQLEVVNYNKTVFPYPINPVGIEQIVLKYHGKVFHNINFSLPINGNPSNYKYILFQTIQTDANGDAYFLVRCTNDTYKTIMDNKWTLASGTYKALAIDVSGNFKKSTTDIVIR